MTSLRRRGGALPALALLAVALVAAGVYSLSLLVRPQPQRGGRLNEALVVDGPMSVIPAFAETPNSRDISGLLFRGLTRTGADGRPVGELARNWTVDPAARTFTFHLKPGLRWSDGAPITSADAVFTLSILQSDADARSSAGQAWGGITVAATGPLTIVYSLPQSSPAFLSLTNIGLLPQHALQPRPVKNLRTITDAPTSGPFTVAVAARDHVLLQRNRHAFEPPYLDELDLRLYDARGAAIQALLAGDVDLFAGLTPDDARRVEAAVNRRVVRGSTFAYAELLFNQKVDTLADGHVRNALGLAINRPGLLNAALGGFGALDESPIPPAVRWASTRVRQPSFDRAAAGRELDAAAWTLNGGTRSRDGKPLKLKMTIPQGPPYAAVAASIEKDLAAVGVVTSSHGLGQEALLSQLQSHQFEVALTALDNGPDPDIYAFWHSSQAGPGGFNFSGMATDAALDKDLEDGRGTADYGRRQVAYLDAQRQILAGHPAVFLYTPQALVGLRDVVHGVVLPPGSQRYDVVQDWYLTSGGRG